MHGPLVNPEKPPNRGVGQSSSGLALSPPPCWKGYCLLVVWPKVIVLPPPRHDCQIPWLQGRATTMTFLGGSFLVGLVFIPTAFPLSPLCLLLLKPAATPTTFKMKAVNVEAPSSWPHACRKLLCIVAEDLCGRDRGCYVAAVVLRRLMAPSVANSFTPLTCLLTQDVPNNHKRQWSPARCAPLSDTM
jgi:hypothetical protein